LGLAADSSKFPQITSDNSSIDNQRASGAILPGGMSGQLKYCEISIKGFDGNHDCSIDIWRHSKGLSLDYCRAATHPVSNRLVDAGLAQRCKAGRRHDISYFLRPHDSLPDHLAIAMARYPSGRPGAFASGAATIGVAGGALAAICAGLCNDDNGLAFRFIPRLVCLIFLCCAVAEALAGKLGSWTRH
jgi:hypothetical protein